MEEEEKYTDEGIEKQKNLIGDFVINFENLNDWMRFIIPGIIFKGNGTTSQNKNIDTLLTDLGAEQLRAKFDSLIHDNFQSYPDFVIRNKELSKKVSQLSNIRNSIVHGSYRLGWKDFQGRLSDDSFSLRHSKPTKNGYEKRSMIISTNDLIELNTNLQKLSSCYNSIHVINRSIWIYKKDDLINRQIENFSGLVKSIKKLNLEHIDILN